MSSATVRRYLLVAAMVAGAALFVAAQALFLHLGKTSADAINGVAPHRGRELAATYCDMLGSAGFVALAVGGWRLLPTGRGSRLATLGGVLLVAGGLSNALGGAVFGYLEYFGTASGVSPAQGSSVLDAANHASLLVSAPISFAAIPVIAVGLLVLAVGLIRSSAAPRWLSIGFTVAAVLTAAMGVGPLAALIGAPYVVGVALLARQVARTA
jgi:hypothetical protein